MGANYEGVLVRRPEEKNTERKSCPGVWVETALPPQATPPRRCLRMWLQPKVEYNICRELQRSRHTNTSALFKVTTYPL